MYPCKHETCPLLEIELITLTQGKYAVVDKDDYAELSKYNWQAAKWGRKIKRYRAIRKKLKKDNKPNYMHRFIMDTPSGMFTDHINHNTLDNRKSNLRICTHSQSNANRRSFRNKTSKYKGVLKRDSEKRYLAVIGFNKKDVRLGRYETQKEAALAYNHAAIKYFGEFACLNTIEPN